jgi:hypothetical protein
LFRDAVVDVLSLNGQTNFNTTGSQLQSITGSFAVNFPSRVSNILPVGSQVILKLNSSTVGGLWLNNSVGGRSYGALESSARALINGTPTFTLGENYFYYSPAASSDPIEIQSNNAESNDLYSPYVILPEDDLIFGWQYPMSDKILRAAPGKSDNFLNSMSLFGNSRLVLYGSQIKDGKEFHEGLNQNLLSDNLHELIGSEPVVDQFDVSRSMEYEDGYLDAYVANESENPVTRVGSTVQSRLTSLKSESLTGRATATISISPDTLYLLGKKGGMNDGLRISLTDHLGNNAHFYGFRNEPAWPKTGASIPANPTHIDDDDDGTADLTRSTTIGWSSAYENLGTLQLDYGSGLSFIRGVRFSVGNGPVQYPVDGAGIGYRRPAGFTDLADEYYSFRIYGGSNTGSTSFSNSDAFTTLVALKQAIDASSLDVTCTTAVESLGMGLGNKYSLIITQNASGVSGNTNVIFKDATDLYASLQDDYRFSISSTFTGGVDSKLSSFSRLSVTEDGARVYVDSRLKSTDIGFSNSNFGTMQTEGAPLRPKYYLSSRKFGQRIHLFEQGKDSKTKQDFKNSNSLSTLDTIKGGSLDAPVKIHFVSGSSSSTTGVQTYVESTPIDAVNKTINSVLTGAFYDRT